MGLYDDMLEEQQQNVVPQNSINKNIKNSSGGLFDDMLAEPQVQPQPQVQTTFAERHPFAASVPDTFREFGVGAYRSYPEFAKGLNDLVALVGDKTGAKGLSDFGRSNAEFWQNTLDNMPQRGEQYQGVKGLTSKSTFLPTIAGSIGDQATNLLTALGGGAGGAKLAAQVGAKGLAKAGLITAGTSLPNIAQEGSYLDKVQAFQEINGRIPTIEEMKQIQNVALAEKATNTALETVSDKLLFGKLFPSGATTKGVKNFLKNAGQQALTEGGTEGMQEGVSIGAEKLLGINQGDNLSRLADSIAIGGVTGGAFGGASHLASQPYNAQFPENTNATNPINGFKSVSAQILNNGQVFYDNAVDTLNNAAQNFNNMVNTPDTFDTLRTLSKNGDLSNGNTFEQLAPNTAKSTKNKKRKVKPTDKINNSPDVSVKDTNVPNMIDNTNLYNVSENGENTITNQETVENIANEVDNTSSENTAVLEKPQTPRERKKAKAKAEVINKLKEIAPNTAAEIETENKNTKEANLFKTNQFVKDNDGNVYETTSNGYIRNVDTDEHSTGDVNRTYEAYTPNENDFIKTQQFTYDKEAKGDTNAHNYAMSKQEVVDSYNNYIKNPTVANREAYQDTYGKFTEEFNKNEEKFKNNPANLEGYPLEKTKNLIPFNPNDNKFNDLEKVDNIDEATHHDMINGGFYKQKDHTEQPLDMVDSAEKNDEIEKVAKQYAEMLGQNEVHDFHRDFAEALIDKKVDRIKELVAHGRGFNENSKKMFTKYTGIKLPTTIKGKIETLEKWSKGEFQKDEEPTFNNSNKTITFKEKDLTTKSGGKAIKISDKYVTNGYIAFVKDYFNFANKESDFEFIDTTKKDYAFNREFNTTLDKYINSDVYTEKLSNPLLTKNRGNSYILFKNGDKYVAFDKKYYDLVKDFDIFTEKNSNNSQAIIRNKSGESIGILMPVMLKDLNTALSIAKPVKLKKNDAIYSSNRIYKESEGDNEQTIHKAGSNGTDTNISQELSTGLQENENRGNDGQRDTRPDISDNENGERIRSTSSNLGNNNSTIKEEHSDLINKNYKNQYELNVAIENFIKNKEYEVYNNNIPEDIKSWLKKYAGAGGLEKQGAKGKGLLTEYYTPQNIVNKMWDLTAQYIETNGAKVLEPSVGIGRFLENAPQNTNFDVVEMSPISAKITELLYPNANVRVGAFQEQFIGKNNRPVKSVTPEYDIVIGNPPYGLNKNEFTGMKEGSNFKQLEAYFISRGLDTLKENGIMTFIVPSSFLKGKESSKLAIANKCELLDAYRLPNGTFGTTDIGTDIIVLRKTKGAKLDLSIVDDRWFNKHPEKILGEVQTGKGNWGSDIVKGDKNAVEKIDTSKKDVKNTVVAKSATTVKSAAKNTDTSSKNSTTKKSFVVQSSNVDYEVYKPEHKVKEEDIELYADTRVDGTLPSEKYSPNEKVNLYKGELYNDFNYLQGNIYEKLDALEEENNISEKQKEIQREKLQKALPNKKSIADIELNPLSDFVSDLDITVPNTFYREYNYRRTNAKEREIYQFDKKEITINQAVIQYILGRDSHLTKNELGNVTKDNLVKYLQGKNISIDYGTLPRDEDCTPEQKARKNELKAQQKSDCREVANRIYNEYVKTNLSQEIQKEIENKYNREYNGSYLPNYLDMPLLIQDVSANFKGNKLKLREAQIEGINFLNNQGVGLLGFDVGVGKTLTSIIATVQNMKMGRCKRPLIICPQPTLRKNWLKEIKELYPNLEINVLGNLGVGYGKTFNGEIKEGTLTLCSYQALDNIWYNKETVSDLLNALYDTSNLNTKNKMAAINRGDIKKDTERKGEKQKQDVEKMFGMAKSGNSQRYLFENLGFDHITVDEAHNFKSLFGNAKAYNEKGSSYNVDGSKQSDRAIRLFLATQYILSKNNNRNVYLLTATPFTNKPLEVFNMFSYIAKDELDKMHCNNVHQFIETFADMKAVDVVNHKNELVTQDVCVGFKNKDVLYRLRDKFMMMRKGKEEELKRPTKHTVKVVLSPTQEQIELIDNIDNMLTSSKNKGAAALQEMMLAMQVTLSPDIATNNFDVTPDDFIKNSPKLEYIAGAIEIQHKSDPYARQIIYSPQGVKFFGKIKEYFVKHKIFKEDEIALITGDTNEDKIAEYIDSFNDKNGKLKLIIGSSTINEGVNLNEYSTTMYLPFTDWNPTQHQQAVGRIWRSGNHYKDCRIVVPLLKNSSDPFKFQKLATKIERINDMMFSGEDAPFIEPEELDAEQQRLALITSPAKKAKAYIHLEKKRIIGEKNLIEGRIETVKTLTSEMESTRNSINSYENYIKELEEQIKELEKGFPIDEKGKPILPENDYSYYSKVNRLKDYKKYLSEYKYKEKRIDSTIKIRELDINGEDSIEKLEEKLKDFDERIKQLEATEEAKKEEFKKEYDKQNREAKTLEEHLKDFKEQTINLYGEKPLSEDSKVIGSEPTKKYEKTREAAYSVPVINLETARQKEAKSSKEKRIEKAKNIVDARKYNKLLKDGVHKRNSEIGIRRYEADRILNSFINITKAIAKEHKINDKNLREIMPFLRERTEIPESLNRPELKKVWDKVHSINGLAERLTQLADSASEKLERFWVEYKAVQASDENIEDKTDIEHYIYHDWDLDNKTPRPLLTHSFITKSRHEKKRNIPTYYEGIEGIEQENGEVKQFKPKTLDYAELLKESSDNLIKATIDKAFADSVKSFKTVEGANLVLPSSQAPSNWVEINHSALNKTVARPISTKYGEKISPELQNKLAEMGIAIGYRLPKHKGNGQLNSAGKYVRNVPPEIRLQRWFSNKTLAHEIGHAIDDKLELSDSGFVSRHRDELLELNKERIDAFTKAGDKQYAEKDTELIAELFGTLFNDIETAYKIAPAATNEVIEKMTKGKLDSLLPANFDWTEAKHILEEKVVEFFKIPVRVHPDIAATLKTVFEPKKDYLEFLGFKPGKVMDEQTAIMKMMEFSISGFHNIALTESYLGNVGVGGLKEALNFKKIFNSIKNNEYDVYKRNKVAEQAIKDGLQIGTPLDIDRGTVDTLVNNVGNWAENHIKGLGKSLSLVAKTTAKGINLLNKALWDVIHNNYKLNTYELLVQNESKDGVISEAKRKEIASWVNDSFGGQVLEALGINPSTKKALSRLLMSPDWLISTTRQFMGFFATEKGHKKLNQLAEKSEGWQKVKDISQALGITSITDDIEATGMRGRIARAFWIRSAILSALYMNILNALFRMWDKDKYPELYPEKLSPKDYSMLGNSTGAKLYIFIGRNADGTERYLRLGKQFREVPEMVADPIKHFGNKLSPAIQTGVVAATGHSVGGFKDKEMANAKGWKRIGLAGKNLGSKYVPLSIQNAYNKTVKKQGADFTPFDLIGNTSKGMSEYKAKEQFLNAFQKGNTEKIADIEKSMAMNGFTKKDIQKVEKSAKTSYTKQFKDGYVAALQNGDYNKIQQISNEMTKKNISTLDQRKIYTKALSDYYKKLGIKEQ